MEPVHPKTASIPLLMAHTRPACWSGRSWPQLSRSGSGRPVVMRRLSLRWVGGLGSWSAGRPAECGTDVPGPRPSPVRRLVPGQRPAVWPGCAATHRRIRRGPTSETFQTKPPASMGWVARHARAAAGRLRTAHKYSNATDRERPQGTATGQRPAPTTANDLPAESRIEGSPIWP